MASSWRGLIRMDLAMHSAAAAKFPCRNDRLSCPQCFIYSDYLRSSWRNTASPECGSSLEVRSRYVDYLARRVYRAISFGRLELRDAQGFVVSPPDHAFLKEPTLLQLKTWFETAYIRVGDYERFCVDEDIPAAPADCGEIYDVWNCRPQGEEVTAQEPVPAVAINVAEDREVTEGVPEKPAAAPSVEAYRLLTYKQLADVFKLENREDDNLKWFKERCSNYRRYSGFGAALVVVGKRGGNPSKFDVFLIASHLNEREGVAIGKLRSSIKNNLPLALSRFDELFGFDS